MRSPTIRKRKPRHRDTACGLHDLADAFDRRRAARRRADNPHLARRRRRRNRSVEIGGDVSDTDGSWFGGWHGPGPVALAPLWMLLKLTAGVIFFIWIRASLPRLRYDQLMSFGWKVLLPLATVNALVTAVVVVEGWPWQW